MPFIVCLLFLLLLFLYWIYLRRREKTIRKIRRMTALQKSALLNRLCMPLGYQYHPTQDIFTSILPVEGSFPSPIWQRSFGYTEGFDLAAPRLNMVFDREKVYFDYGGRTWLIEFWKGQYGITVGGEIGIYHADRIVPRDQLDTAGFACAADAEMLPLGLELFYGNELLAHVESPHFWLAAFSLGRFARPADLTLQVFLVFPEYAMQEAFSSALRQNGCAPEAGDGVCRGTLARFTLDIPHTPPAGSSLSRRLGLYRCFLLTGLFRWITRPLESGADRLLLLYEQLPSVFRRSLRPRRFSRR